MQEQFPKETITQELTAEQRVHDMQQEFMEKREEVLKAEREKTTPSCNLHYGYVDKREIENIDEADLIIRDKIRSSHIYSEEDYKIIREKFDEYFIKLDPEKIHIGGLLAIELRNKQAEFIKKRNK